MEGEGETERKGWRWINAGKAEKPPMPLRSAFATAASVAAGKLKNKRRNKEAEET